MSIGVGNILLQGQGWKQMRRIGKFLAYIRKCLKFYEEFMLSLNILAVPYLFCRYFNKVRLRFLLFVKSFLLRCCHCYTVKFTCRLENEMFEQKLDGSKVSHD